MPTRPRIIAALSPAGRTLAKIEALPTSEDTEEGLFKQWEDYLMKRVGAAAQSSQSMAGISPAVLEALRMHMPGLN